MSINLKVEEYCQNCPYFEPVTKVSNMHCGSDNPNYYALEAKLRHDTIIECKNKRRCAAQMKYLQKQHDAMKKKETGNGKDN